MSNKEEQLKDRMKKKKNVARTFMEGMVDNSLEKEELESTLNVNVNVLNENKNDVITEFEKAFGRRRSIEQTHKRQTFLIKKELIQRFDRLAKKNSKGFKTFAVNYALEKMLEELEED